MNDRPRKRRLPGMNASEKRFAKVDTGNILIPMARDACTYIYLADENGQFPEGRGDYVAKIMYDVTWLQEGQLVRLENLAPGNMGMMGWYQVIEVELVISIDQPRQKKTSAKTTQFGQVKRLVLLQPTDDFDKSDDPQWLKAERGAA